MKTVKMIKYGLVTILAIVSIYFAFTPLVDLYMDIYSFIDGYIWAFFAAIIAIFVTMWVIMLMIGISIAIVTLSLGFLTLIVAPFLRTKGK